MIKDCGGLEKELVIGTGCRVMLTYNIDVSDGLSNGATGTVSHIVAVANNVIKILVQFDNPGVGIKAKRLSQYRDVYPNSIPISRQEAHFNIGKRKSASAFRKQFPLQLAWASTIHKVQGLTTDTIVVSFEGTFYPGQAYVALSRVRNLSGLYILNFDPAKIKVDDAITSEMERLRKNPLKEISHHVNQDSDIPNLRLSHLNVRGIKYHQKDLELDELVMHSDILCLSETFLKNEDKFSGSSLNRNDMNVFCVNRPHEASKKQAGSGGILVAARQDLKPKLVGNSISNDLEQLTIQLENNMCPLYIISVYRPPRGNMKLFLEELALLLKQINAVNIECILVGDFNEDISNSAGSISPFLQSYGFQQRTKKATRDSGSLLDHTYTSAKINITSCSVRDTYYSDHDFVSLVL